MTRPVDAPRAAGGSSTDDLEQLIIEVSAALVAATDAEVGEAVAAVLGRIGRGLNLDRVSVGMWASDDETLQLQSRWTAPGVPLPPAVVSRRDFPWVTGRILEGEAAVFSDLEELPESAAVDRQSFLKMGTRSHYSAPLRVGGRSLGALSLGLLRRRRPWSDLPLPRLQLLGHLVAEALVRERAYDELRSSEERYGRFVELSAEGIWCMEFGDSLALDLPEEEAAEQLYARGRVVEANDAFARMYGFADVAELGTWAVKDFLPYDDRTLRMLRAVVRSGYRLSDLESTERDRDGNMRIFLNNVHGEIEDGALLRIWGTAREVTGLRAAERQMRLQAAAIEALDVGCVIADAQAADMPIVYLNKAFSVITGYEQDEVLGRNCRFLQGEDTDPRTRRAIREALASGEAFAGEILNYTRTGDAFWNLLRIVPVREEDGTVTYFVATQSDVTSRRNRTLELNQLKSQLAHVGRLATMGELTAAIAHELNQPLTAIAANARVARRLLASEEVDREELAEILVDIEADDERAAGVIRGTRAMMTSSEVREALDLETLVREVAELLHSDALFKSLSTRFDLEGGLPPVRGNAVQIQQVLLNLFMNAGEAMQGMDASERRLVIGAVRVASGVRVFVSDRGPGFGEVSPEALFTPFETTKSSGMGMGLAIAKTIVETHGGQIWARENRGEGVTFSFTLPVHEGETGACGARPADC